MLVVNERMMGKYVHKYMTCGDGMSVSSEKTGSTYQHRCGRRGTGAG